MTAMPTSQEDAQEAKRRKLEAKLTGGAAPIQQQQQQAAKKKESDTAEEDAAEEERSPFVCDANDVVAFRLVACAADMDAAEVFEPEFTHQVFRDDETIFGRVGTSHRVIFCSQNTPRFG
jgi:histone acetyltransferase 1